MPGFGPRESTDAGRTGATGRVIQWTLAQVRLHPVRSLGILALIGAAGWRALAPRPTGWVGRLRRLR
jgi:hypothetical protein